MSIFCVVGPVAGGGWEKRDYIILVDDLSTALLRTKNVTCTILNRKYFPELQFNHTNYLSKPSAESASFEMSLADVIHCCLLLVKRHDS